MGKKCSVSPVCESLYLVLISLVTVVLCQSQLCDKASDCVTDLTQSECDKTNQYLFENSTVCQLCPSCVSRNGFGQICLTDAQCAPGLKCVNSACDLDRANCLSAYHKQIPVLNLPSCNPDGTWKPVQCKGDRLIGRCFCYSATGKRIFGMAWAPNATDMTCACSRYRHDLETAGRTDVTFHCSENGNYEPLQCDGDICWCADEKTGVPISTVVTTDLVTQLPCYDVTKYGSQYMRLCESKTYAIALMKNKLAIHGTTQVTYAEPKCDYDGTFGVYQVDNGNAYCSWKDSSRLGSWQTVAGALLAKVNCNCARDSKFFALANKAMTMLCSGNGNYEPLQEQNGYLFCVDDDGYPTTDLMEFGEQVDCSIYA